jgi:hypothetical protein
MIDQPDPWPWPVSLGRLLLAWLYFLRLLRHTRQQAISFASNN